MLPPTPTPLPNPAASGITVNAASWKIWAMTDEAITIINTSNRFGVLVMFQIIAVGLLIFVFIYLVRACLKDLMSGGGSNNAE